MHFVSLLFAQDHLPSRLFKNSLALQVTADVTGPALLDDIAFKEYEEVHGEWAGLLETPGAATTPNIVLDQVVGSRGKKSAPAKRERV